MNEIPTCKKCIAELIGTFWLVFGGCGAAVFACGLDGVGIGYAGVALAFGLTVLTMAYCISHISGCHLNPAVSFGLWACGRMPGKDLLPYIVSQVVGAILGSLAIYAIVSGSKGFDLATCTLAANGFGELSPGGAYSMGAGIVAEIVLTFIFLMVICGSTDKRAPQGFAPIAIGLCLTLIHLISIPVTNTSVNPARSTGPDVIMSIIGQPDAGAYMGQLWFFWVMPIVGAVLAGLCYKLVFEKKCCCGSCDCEKKED